MLLTFVENRDKVWYKKIEIEFDDNSGIEEFRFDDIIKDDKIENLQYYYDLSSTSDINKIIKLYGFDFDKYDSATKKIYLKQNPNFNDENLLKEYDYFIMKYFKYKLPKDKSIIAIDTIFNIEDLDIDKFETIKEMSKDYDSIKITEYQNDEKSNFNPYLSNKHDNKYIFDLSILNEVLLIDESKNKLYVLKCPIGLEYKLIGIENYNNVIFLKYDDLIDYKKDNIELDITKIEDSNISPTNGYIFSNIFIKTKSIDEDILNKYNKQMKTLFEMDIICGVYDL
jgi:hypothetical protein